MNYNWARTTTTTTGTGNLTLSSVSGYPTINDVVGQGQRFAYAILDDSTGAPLEAGIGYLSASTTMVREKVTETYSSSTYDNTSPATLSLASGTKRVIVTGLTRSVMAPLPYMGSAAGYKGVGNANLFGTIGSNLYNAGDASGRFNCWPWRHEYGGEIDAFITQVTTAGGAGTILRIGLYRIGSDGNPAGLIVESGSIDVASTGVKTSTFTAFVLPPGNYWFAYLSTATTAFYMGCTGVGLTMRMPSSVGNALDTYGLGGYALGVSTSAMPSTAPPLTWSANLSVPNMLIRAV